jgi:glyoxylase-like metal-dependent hydrolase (beta-lactamase superfamily II)
MKIKVLKEGVHEDHIQKDGPLKNKLTKICSTVVLLQGKQNILVDTGYASYEKEIVSLLKKEWIKPADIDLIINTHSHFDHVHNNYLFKKADMIVGKAIWHPDGSLDVYNNTEDIKIEGLKLIATPGHKDDHISVVVETEGKTCVVAGDAFTKLQIEKNLFNEEGKKSALKVAEIADVIIPGHGKTIEKDEIKKLAGMIR